MAISTYSELKNALADWLADDSLSGRIDDFIDLAESVHKREIRIQEMINRDSLTVDDRYISLPSGLLEPIIVRLLTTPVTVLSEINLHEMTRQRSTTTGKPTRYTIHEQIEFDVSPDQSYSGEIVYYKAETALSDSNTSNNILARAPDVYLYGALLQSGPFVMHDERIPVWRAYYEDARNTLNASTKRTRRAGPLISRVSGATP